MLKLLLIILNYYIFFKRIIITLDKESKPVWMFKISKDINKKYIIIKNYTKNLNFECNSDFICNAKLSDYYNISINYKNKLIKNINGKFNLFDNENYNILFVNNSYFSNNSWKIKLLKYDLLYYFNENPIENNNVLIKTPVLLFNDYNKNKYLNNKINSKDKKIILKNSISSYIINNILILSINLELILKYDNISSQYFNLLKIEIKKYTKIKIKSKILVTNIQLLPNKINSNTIYNNFIYKPFYDYLFKIHKFNTIISSFSSQSLDIKDLVVIKTIRSTIVKQYTLPKNCVTITNTLTNLKSNLNLKGNNCHKNPVVLNINISDKIISINYISDNLNNDRIYLLNNKSYLTQYTLGYGNYKNSKNLERNNFLNSVCIIVLFFLIYIFISFII